MDLKFHRDTATIYSFNPPPRLETSPRVEPRLYSADIVALRPSDRVPVPRAVHEEVVRYADFGSGWYHDDAIEKDEPAFRH